jgi:hypothetical protein
MTQTPETLFHLSFQGTFPGVIKRRTGTRSAPSTESNPASFCLRITWGTMRDDRSRARSLGDRKQADHSVARCRIDLAAESVGIPLPPYRGPYIDILSVQAVKTRLTQAHQEKGMSKSTIDCLAGWWPKSVVAKRGFTASHIYVLTQGVHQWWSDLWLEVHSGDYGWPEKSIEGDIKTIKSKITGFAALKSAAAERGLREMEDAGEAISANTIIQMDE